MFELFQRQADALAATNKVVFGSEQQYQQIRKGLDNCPEIQAVHRNRQTLQDRLWQLTLADINQDKARLEQAYHHHSASQLGELQLDSALEIPSHQHKTEIHRMPGGYLQDGGDDDFWLGALYDHGVFLYGQGWFGALNDELGQTLIHNVLAQQYPNLAPQKILDMGCSVGHSTLPYATAFPEAEIWGIDVGAALLRYGSARAKALGQTVYFAQQNAEHTAFADQSFDLVVSHILLHEIPGVARKRVFAESYRLLKPGGLMVHLESKLFLSPPSLAARYFRDTEVWVNSEPYLGSSRVEDFPAYAEAAGFNPENFQMNYVPGYYGVKKGNSNAGWVVFCGEK